MSLLVQHGLGRVVVMLNKVLEDTVSGLEGNMRDSMHELVHILESNWRHTLNTAGIIKCDRPALKCFWHVQRKATPRRH
jgi:hypothetical protein